MTDDDQRPTNRPNRPPPREGELVFVPARDSEPPITQRAIPLPVPVTAPPRRDARPVVRAVTASEMLDERMAEMQKHLSQMSLQQDHLGSIVNSRFDILHEELALTRHDVAETAKAVEELREMVKDNHEPRLQKVEHSVAQKVRVGGTYGGLVLIGSIVTELFPQWGSLIRAVLNAGAP